MGGSKGLKDLADFFKLRDGNGDGSAAPGFKPGASDSTDKPRLGELLVEQGVITAEELARALSRQFGVPYVDLNTCDIRPEALKLLSESTARKYNVIPIAIRADALQVAMGDANDVHALEALFAQTKMRIEPLIAVPEGVRKAIDRNYKSYGEIQKQFTGVNSPVVVAKARLFDDSIAEAPAVRALDLVIEEAVKNRASDIHIEPAEDKLDVRFRIDGVLHPVVSLPLSAHAPLISRIKILGSMNIADHRPQDGQFSLKVRDKDIDVRVATIASAYGEMVTLRILDKSFAILDLKDIGFLPESLGKYQGMLRSPFGMILISGPTGSGKTTTLYASINGLDRKSRNIITIEDPIEYRFKGINQIQVNARAGLTFSTGLRAIMRHDPNIILVGEIRDTDTASIAVQAALTGHLLLASVHANDSVGVLFRLVDLGVEPFLVSTALIGVVSQRMVRRVCPHCRQLTSASVEGEIAYEMELGEEKNKFAYGKGCARCAGSGYLGRIAIFEILVLSEEIRRLFLKGASASEMREQARKEGMVSMRHDAMLKVKVGITTPDEVLRHVFTITQ
jgi:type II secretory ATPase GspE/PulE/Tfp pilus assembly ATPase PilB-like protein